MTATLLSVDHVEVRYGPVPAIRDLTLEVDKGEIVTLLGANGAGKTTTLRMISGLHKPFAGSVHLDGIDITTAPPHHLVDLGLSHVPEGRRIFPHHDGDREPRDGRVSAQGQLQRRVRPHLHAVPVLGERRKQLGGTLSGGEQQMLAIGRAMMAKPEAPAARRAFLGLAPKIIEAIFQIIVRSARRVSRCCSSSRTPTRH